LLFLEVPNLRGLNLKLLQWTHSPLLAAHNLAIMDPTVIEAMTTELGLETIEIKYVGGYEPLFIDAAESSLLFRAAFGLGARVRRWRLLDTLNAPWISGYLYGVFIGRSSAPSAFSTTIPALRVTPLETAAFGPRSSVPDRYPKTPQGGGWPDPPYRTLSGRWQTSLPQRSGEPQIG
jgi:hypothetical protein